jgi:hypothetical protein
MEQQHRMDMQPPKRGEIALAQRAAFFAGQRETIEDCVIAAAKRFRAFAIGIDMVDGA